MKMRMHATHPIKRAATDPCLGRMLYTQALGLREAQKKMTYLPQYIGPQASIYFSKVSNPFQTLNIFP